MAAYDQLLEGAGQDKFLQLYNKYDDTMAALKAGTSGQSFEGNGAGSAPSFKTRFVDIQIGDWNMDSTATKAVAHGLTAPAYKKIRVLSVIIRDDADTVYSPLNNVDVSGQLNGVVASIDSTNINLSRDGGGDYDNSNYNSTSFNRGFITIYIAD